MQGMVPVAALHNVNVMVFSSTGLLKVALMLVFDGTSSLPNAGFVAITFGAAILSASIGPFLPQAIVKHSRRKTTLDMAVSLFKTVTLESPFYFHHEPVIVVIIDVDVR